MIHVKIMEELPWKPLRVRWLCMTTTKKPPRENSPEPPLHSVQPSQPGPCPPPAAASGFGRSDKPRGFAGVAVVPGPGRPSPTALAGAPGSPVPTEPSLCGCCEDASPYPALLLASKPRGPGRVSLFTSRAQHSSRQTEGAQKRLCNDRLIDRTDEKPLEKQN